MTCSGTIGAAIEASHCGKKAIAVSFAFMREEGFDDDDVHIACEISWKIIHKLLQNWPDDVDLFNINVPVFKNMPTELEVHISSIHQNSYAGLFKPKVFFSFFFFFFFFFSLFPFHQSTKLENNNDNNKNNK